MLGVLPGRGVHRATLRRLLVHLVLIQGQVGDHCGYLLFHRLIHGLIL